MDKALLELKGVWKLYGFAAALADVTVSVAAGESILLYGPNGAGKSTLLHILASLLRPTQGEVRWKGKRIHDDIEQYRRSIGFLSHAIYLYGELTARENLRFFAKLFEPSQRGSGVEDLLQFFHLRKRADEPVRNLSRGLQQRVSLARALLHDPEMLLLDEPFTGLDEASVELLTERLRQEQSKGKCIFLATHDLHRGTLVATRWLRLDQGRVSSDEPLAGNRPPAEKFLNPVPFPGSK